VGGAALLAEALAVAGADGAGSEDDFAGCLTRTSTPLPFFER